MMLDLEILAPIVAAAGYIFLRYRKVASALGRIKETLLLLGTLTANLTTTIEEIETALADERLTEQEIRRLRKDFNNIKQTVEKLLELI